MNQDIAFQFSGAFKLWSDLTWIQRVQPPRLVQARQAARLLPFLEHDHRGHLAGRPERVQGVGLALPGVGRLVTMDSRGVSD
jgi:hypothetical protein